MNVRWKCSIPLFAALAGAALANPAQGQDPNAHLYLVNAVPGRNISSTTNPEYPVDVSIHGFCVGQGLSFGQIRGPFTGPPGSDVVKVSVADVASPCGGTTVFTATISLTAGTSSLGIVALNSSHEATWLLYGIDLASVAVGSGHLIVANTTADNLTGTITVDDTTGSPISANLPAGSLNLLTVHNGEYSAWVYPEGSTVVATGPVRVDVISRNVSLYVIAGSTTNDSIQIIGPKDIRDVF